MAECEFFYVTQLSKECSIKNAFGVLSNLPIQERNWSGPIDLFAFGFQSDPFCSDWCGSRVARCIAPTPVLHSLILRNVFAETFRQFDQQSGIACDHSNGAKRLKTKNASTWCRSDLGLEKT